MSNKIISLPYLVYKYEMDYKFDVNSVYKNSLFNWLTLSLKKCILLHCLLRLQTYNRLTIK